MTHKPALKQTSQWLRLGRAADVPRPATENQAVLTHRILRLPTLALVAVLQACVYVPRTTQVFDPECQMVSRHMVLQEVQVAAIHGCANEACIALIVGAGIVTAASVVISGPIVVAGNIAYWFESKSPCQRVQR